MFVLVAKEVSMGSQEQLEEEGSMLIQDIFLEDLPKHLSPMR
jgi:hypothetical protein